MLLFRLTACGMQFRKSGEPFITHPVEVTRILAELKMDYESLIAGLLHDTVEDTENVKFEEIEVGSRRVLFLMSSVVFRWRCRTYASKTNFMTLQILMVETSMSLLLGSLQFLHSTAVVKCTSVSEQCFAARP